MSKQFHTEQRPAIVARIIKEKIKRGEKIVLREILADQGYAPTVQNNPLNVTEAQSFKAVMDPFVARLEKHRNEVIVAMEGKDLKEEQYRTLVDANARLTHDIQLLTGGKTENLGIEEDRKTLVAILADIRVTS